MLALGFAGAAAWYFLKPPQSPPPSPPPATVGNTPPKADPAQQPVPVTVQLPPEVPADIGIAPGPQPFAVPLPAPLSESDMLRFIADAYDSSEIDSSRLAIARGFLQTPAARAAADWLRARSGAALPLQWYAAFHEAFPDWPLTDAMRRRAEAAFLARQAPDAVKKLYFSANPPLTIPGKVLWARLLLADGDSNKAAELIRPIWRQEPLSASSEQQIRTDFAAVLTPADHRSRMAFHLQKKNWDDALKVAKDAGAAAEAIVKARIAVAQNNKKAQALLDAVPKEQQADPLLAYSRMLLLVRADKMKDTAALIGRLSEDKTLQTPQRFLTAAECRDWTQQQRWIVRKLMDDNAFDDAYKAASAQLSRIGCIHNDADFLAGWIALRFLNRIDAAGQHFDALARNADTPSLRARAAYWQGRVAEQKQLPDAARAAYQRAAQEWLTFYGQIAAEKLSDQPPMPQPAPIPAEIQQRFNASTAVSALRLLDEAGADAAALSLYGELASYLPDQPQMDALAALATGQRNPRALLTVAKTGMRRGFTMGAWAYPTFGIPEVADNDKPVEASLLYAIAHQESAFNPRAKSHAGALGLMQLMPETARTTASRAGLEFSPARLTADPAYNARLGAAHLNDLLGDWRGSLILTFAAYNAGGGNVKKWIAAHGDPRAPDVDMIDWIERIPFFETRHYVQRISENLMIYRQLMNAAKPSLFATEVTTSATGTAAPVPAIPEPRPK